MAQLIDDKGKKFEDEWDRIAADIAFEAWFTRNQWPKALAFIGGILGLVSLLMSCYFCCFGQFTNGMVRSMMFVSAPHVAQAATLQSGNIVELSKNVLFLFNFISHGRCNNRCDGFV